MNCAMPYAIFTDIDGTLLNERYALPFDRTILQRAFEQHRVVFASSRTADELVHLQRRLGVSGDCIIENGGALLLREKSTAEQFATSQLFNIENDSVWIAPLVEPVENFMDDVQRETKRHNLACRFLQDLDDETLAAMSGYEQDDARRAKSRRFGVLLVPNGESNARIKTLTDGLKLLDFTVTFGGKWLTVSRGADKGVAMKEYLGAMQKKGVLFTSVAIGNEENDLTMLEAAHKKFVIKNPTRGYTSLLASVTGATLLKQEGALGWTEMLAQL